MERRRPTVALAMLAVTLAVAAIALVGPQPAHAGYGVQPIGQTITVSIGSTGAVVSPDRIDFLVFLDAQDSDPHIWVSDSPAIAASGAPAGAVLGSCDAAGVRPWTEPGKYICAIGTSTLRPGRTLYWWLDYRRLEAGATTPQKALSGPFAFTLVAAPTPASPPATTPPATRPTVRTSTKTYQSAATLPTAERYAGSRSIKHARLTSVIYRTMSALGSPRTLAVGCWSEFDFEAVAASADFLTHDGESTLAGFWLGRQPRWLHLAPSVCSSVQKLLDTRQPTSERAFGLTVALHETVHAYGIGNEAQTNCLAVQLVGVAARFVGLTPAAGARLQRLAVEITRRTAPPGYWNASRCRDGGLWDLFPKSLDLR